MENISASRRFTTLRVLPPAIFKMRIYANLRRMNKHTIHPTHKLRICRIYKTARSARRAHQFVFESRSRYNRSISAFQSIYINSKMSLIPLRFHDWWDDWDTVSPFRSSRLLDQHFGVGLRRDDLLSSFLKPAPSVTRSGYIRPWDNAKLSRHDSGSTLNLDKEKFQVILDVQQFTPNEITVKTTDSHIIVEGKHEEKVDEHGYIARHFVRRYKLPVDINPNDISSTLSSDGVLTVTAPLVQKHAISSERVVPIQNTGPTKSIAEESASSANEASEKVGLP